MKLKDLTAATVNELASRCTAGTMVDKETQEQVTFTTEELANMIWKAAYEGNYQIGGHKFYINSRIRELLESNGFNIRNLYSPYNLAVDDGVIISWE